MLAARALGPARPALAALLIALASGAAAAPALAHPATAAARLSRIGPAPDFSDGTRLALADLRGKVVAVTFMYASCADTCPMLTAKLVGIQRRLRSPDAARARFVAITVDPARDRPEALRQYGAAHGARPPAWAFLTGAPDEIEGAARRYGVYAKRQPGGDVGHSFLTSLIDRDGVLRVQYLGVRFDPDEFLRDLRALLAEARR